MVYDVETFTKIKQAEERDLILIVGQENAIRNSDQCRFGAMAGAEAVLGVRKEVVDSEVVVQLSLHHLVNYFGYDWSDGYGSEVSRIGRIAGFMNRIHEGVFPLRWDITSNETRVNQMEQYGADHGQTHFKICLKICICHRSHKMRYQTFFYKFSPNG